MKTNLVQFKVFEFPSVSELEKEINHDQVLVYIYWPDGGKGTATRCRDVAHAQEIIDQDIKRGYGDGKKHSQIHVVRVIRQLVQVVYDGEKLLSSKIEAKPTNPADPKRVAR